MLALKSPARGEDTLRFELMLSADMLEQAHLYGSLVNSFDINPNRLVMLATARQYYLLGWGGVAPFGKAVNGPVSAYAFTPDSQLMTIRNKELCMFDDQGYLSVLFNLPNDGMGIASGKNVMYVFDRQYGAQKYALYVIAPGGSYTKLVEVPTPITSIIELNDKVVFSTGNRLFSFSVKTKEMSALAALPPNDIIKSVTADVGGSVIYFSTDNTVYVLRGSKVTVVTAKFSGILKYYGGGLIVFNPAQSFLIKIDGIESMATDKK